MTQRYLKGEDIAIKLVCFGANGISTFQGLRFEVRVQIQQQYVPFVISVHCTAHQTKFAIQNLFNLPLVFCIENLLQCLYGYFNHSPKRHFEFTKLAKIMEIKGNKIMHNIKTSWISMINFIKRVLSKYHTLFMKIALDAATIPLFNLI